MKRQTKISIITEAIQANHLGQPLSEHETRWLAEHIIDALKAAKKAGRQ